MCQRVVIFLLFLYFIARNPSAFVLFLAVKKFNFELFILVIIVNYSNINTGQLIPIFLTLRPLKKPQNAF